ncbi:hypothetical protein CEXT_648561 [Caerostris extrusa]|uniref:Uncharacterized protein n=1 Tax=Caerostris extrusa TaxID=172846 RepID=A0AAV4N6H9_CAEEX|nr:hypothetical protein CEXT_648561 [Caerostris extrusa]
MGSCIFIACHRMHDEIFFLLKAHNLGKVVSRGLLGFILLKPPVSNGSCALSIQMCTLEGFLKHAVLWKTEVSDAYLGKLYQ